MLKNPVDREFCPEHNTPIFGALSTLLVPILGNIVCGLIPGKYDNKGD